MGKRWKKSVRERERDTDRYRKAEQAQGTRPKIDEEEEKLAESVVTIETNITTGGQGR